MLVQAMRLLVVALAISLLAGCSWTRSAKDAKKEAEERTSHYTEKDFYDRIQRDLNARDWTKAIENLDALEARYPFGTYADQAQLELIYARYSSLDFEAAIAAADRFIRLHPRHASVDYAYYVKGMALLRSGRGLFDEYLPRDETKRDPGSARLAFNTFNDLITGFPDSAYAPEARQHMVHLRNLLARQEIHVANYYFKRGAYLAAVNRGRHVVENYERTPAVADGLAVMAQGYHMLGLPELADNAARTLALNFPQHPALDGEGNFLYQDDVFDRKSWWHILTLGRYTPDKPPYFDSRPLFGEGAIGAREPPPPEDPETAPRQHRSWLSRLTFGVFDG
ncbi:MAG: outer membrane protein assembly factor BamD [Porticoccaceae bacterium]